MGRVLRKGRVLMKESVSPEQIEKATFGMTLRGYDRDEVDIFLRRVADELRESQRLRSEKLYENLGDEIGALLQHAKDNADAMRKEAEEESARIRAEAEASSREMRAEAESAATEKRAEADMDAQRMRSDAERDAANTRDEANRDATQRIDEADGKVARLQEAEDQLRAKLALLRADLEGLTDQLRRLEHPAEEIRIDDTQQAISLEPEPQPEPETAG
jgi:DivIVA domain-containing protein